MSDTYREGYFEFKENDEGYALTAYRTINDQTVRNCIIYLNIKYR